MPAESPRMPPSASTAAATDRPVPPKPLRESGSAQAEKIADFVCEDDVRQAVRQGRKIVIGERTIVTPAARDLGEEHHVFIQAGWPR
jgi:hypothetical protein